MGELKVFSNNELGEVRTVIKNGEAWFITKDVCNVLEISKHRDAIARLDEEDRGSVLVDTLGGKQTTSTINESGLYSLIMTSRKPEAKKFKKWVTSEVLPSIRKHGAYATENTIDKILNNPDYGIMLLNKLKEEQEEKRKLKITAEKQKKEIEFKQEMINGLVEDVPLTTKRNIINRVVKMNNGGDYSSRYSELYRAFDEKFHMRSKARYEAYKLKSKADNKHRKRGEKISIESSRLGYIDKVLGLTNELYEICLKLYESDVSELRAQLIDLGI